MFLQPRKAFLFLLLCAISPIKSSPVYEFDESEQELEEAAGSIQEYISKIFYCTDIFCQLTKKYLNPIAPKYYKDLEKFCSIHFSIAAKALKNLNLSSLKKENFYSKLHYCRKLETESRSLLKNEVLNKCEGLKKFNSVLGEINKLERTPFLRMFIAEKTGLFSFIAKQELGLNRNNHQISIIDDVKLFLEILEETIELPDFYGQTVDMIEKIFTDKNYLLSNLKNPKLAATNLNIQIKLISDLQKKRACTPFENSLNSVIKSLTYAEKTLKFAGAVKDKCCA